MPRVVIDGRAVEVEAGTNVIEAGRRVGIEIPHYCYHPRLSVVGQCRMCLVKLEGVPKLQTACTTQVLKDGMSVLVDDPEVKAAQEGMMEFFLLNHPLDCPICDQAGECGLQDYSFKHGQAFSRFAYEEKRTYPGRERIALGPNVVLNMNRCIQCTRCVRFTEEISRTGELGFFQRGHRAEIGVFPGRVLDNDLATCVVDICPVGALTSTQFRFAERVWYLDKKPSLCTGCDVGCNVTLEHRRGGIRRYKPRFNPEVNDYWMCDHGRDTARRYDRATRLATPLVRRRELEPVAWSAAVAATREVLVGASRGLVVASGHQSTEEAYLLRALAESWGGAETVAWREDGPRRSIPNPAGGVTGGEAAPNRRGLLLAGFGSGELPDVTGAAVLVADGDPGSSLHAPDAVAALRRADRLLVLGWAETPLSAVADVVLPTATHAEREGTFVNVDWRLQRFTAAFPPPTGVRPAAEVLAGLLAAIDPTWADAGAAAAFRRLAEALPELAGLELADVPATGVVVAPPAGTEGAR